MENKREDRIQRLLQVLKSTDKLHLKEAAALLEVSEMTIRRDINAAPVSVILLGGYIMADPKNTPVTHYFIGEQKNRHVMEKQHIACLAAEHIKTNDTVFFDCGTTTPYIIDSLPDSLSFTALCYSFNTFLALQEKPNCRVILCGGEFKASNSIFVPVSHTRDMDLFRPDKAFISAAGVSLEYGVTCFNFDELQMKHHALKIAQHKILVVDSSKFDEVRPAAIAPLLQFDQLITDQLPDEHFQNYCHQHGITITA